MTTTETKHLLFTLDREAVATIYRHAQAACLGGRSNIRPEGEREESLLIDQMVGLIGNWTLSVWRDGDARAYMDSRHAQNRAPSVGDGGFDLPRCSIDVKTSMMRGGQDPADYRLAVRPRERHEGWVYALCLVRPFTLESLKQSPRVTALLMGWITDDSLPEFPEDYGPFAGAYTVPAKDLYPFIPLKYSTT